ncbi:MAG: amino acid-binding protein [Planctomycetes bacterium]|nr:amino acid-binding protein [Planctomycetota bacterium]MBI3833098.1 amino acid-binding protein [Planctomycetota bacterium]
MPYSIGKVEVWAGDIPNQPGTLAGTLEALAKAGAKLEFLIARKVDDMTSRVFVSPIKGKKLEQAAAGAGLFKAANLFGIRIEGSDKPGTGAKIARAVAEAGINIRGASAAGLGKCGVMYLAVESEADMKNAMKSIKSGLAESKAKAKSKSKKKK